MWIGAKRFLQIDELLVIGRLPQLVEIDLVAEWAIRKKVNGFEAQNVQTSALEYSRQF